VLVGSTLLLIGFALLLAWRFDYLTVRKDVEATGCTIISAPNLLLLVYSIVICVSGFSIAIKLRGERDNLGIRTEFVQLTWSYSILIILFLVSRRLDPKKDREWTFLFQAVAAAIPVIYSLIIPIWRSYQRQLISPPTDRNRLLELLRTPEGYLSFLRFLEKEFSTENLVFYSAVETYHQECKNGSFSIDLVSRLYDEYIRPGAPMQINVSHEILRDIESKLNQYQQAVASGGPGAAELQAMTNIFDVAQGEIFELMKADSFSRYSMLDPDSRRSLISVDRSIELSGTSSERVLSLTPRAHSADDTEQKSPGSVTGPV